MNTSLTAISGGIGSGKSVVSRMLLAMGFPVYDCDTRAREIMDTSEDIRRRIADEISKEVVCANGEIDRKKLSSIVFADKEALNRLNRIVHGAVVDDILRWRESLPSSVTNAWVESAIIYESGIDRIVDCVWEVVAPEALRIERVMSRNGIGADQVRMRIESQRMSDNIKRHPNVHQLINDDVTALLPQVLALLD